MRERERILFLSRCQAYITSPAFLSGRRVSESVKLIRIVIVLWVPWWLRQ